MYCVVQDDAGTLHLRRARPNVLPEMDVRVSKKTLVTVVRKTVVAAKVLFVGCRLLIMQTLSTNRVTLSTCVPAKADCKEVTTRCNIDQDQASYATSQVDETRIVPQMAPKSPS